MRAGIVAPGHLARLGQGSVEIKGRFELERLQAPLIGGPELLERMHERVGRRMTQPAMRGRAQDAIELVDFVDVVACAVA